MLCNLPIMCKTALWLLIFIFDVCSMIINETVVVFLCAHAFCVATSILSEYSVLIVYTSIRMESFWLLLFVIIVNFSIYLSISAFCEILIFSLVLLDIIYIMSNNVHTINTSEIVVTNKVCPYGVQY